MKKLLSRLLIVVVSSMLSPSGARAGVILNEIFYHSPNDLDQLEFVELFNDGAGEVDLTGWKLTSGVSFSFSDGTVIEPNGFVVICKNEELFSEFYNGVATAGEFKKSLSNSSDKINLKDADGELVESVQYRDRAPWPVSPDGYSASVERICPSSASTNPANWAPSELSDDYQTMPSGSPGRKNSAYKERLPPEISDVIADPGQTCMPGAGIDVRATAIDADEVTLLYRVARPGGESEETGIEMQRDTDDRYTARIPGQEPNRIVRLRVRATGTDGAARIFPHENALRPALSVYVAEPVSLGSIPVAQFFNVGEEEFVQAEQYRADSGRSRGRGGFGGGFGRRPRFTAEDRARMEAGQALRPDALAAAWSALTLKNDLSDEQRNQLLPAFRAARLELTALRKAFESTADVRRFAATIPGEITALGDTLRKNAASMLNESQQELLAGFGVPNDQQEQRRGFRGTGGAMLQRVFDIESIWFDLTMAEAIAAAEISDLQPVFVAAIEKRDATELSIGEGGRPDFAVMIEAIESQRDALNQTIAVTLGDEKNSKLRLPGRDNPFGRRPGGRRGFGGGRGAGGSSAALPPQGRSAFIYTDPKSGATQLFDFVNISRRKSGHKVRLRKDRPLYGMTSINVLYEPGDTTILNEALAYDLYRAAGNASQRAGYLRLMMDGHLVGHHLWFEQPNGAFFRHNDIDDGGNLYKVIWQGGNTATRFTPDDKIPHRRGDIVGRHEKKSNPHSGYEDLISLIENLESADGDDAMWRLIQDSFDVDQVINYFAVNSLISHWDGFFNNYFLYHDTRLKKWTMYPWDQDSTWSQRGGNPDDLYEMPLKFGAEDAQPPGAERGRGRGGFGRGGFGWWRDGGEISKPLLANPQFYDRYLKRLRQLCETTFTEDEFGSRIDALRDALEEEVRLRAQAENRHQDAAVANLERIMASLKRHLIERRKFVLLKTKEVSRLSR